MAGCTEQSLSMKRLLCGLIAVTFLALPLSGCGKKGSPHPPGPAKDVIYPRTYPPND
ncbi:LPS translocon maturation chaperone LptM [Acetobacter thailandicus]|uniref:LPS translocon maturation chaperone LptM n=1 Tax=Acetobacter thailandicus TaxID=1502842 RepID=UPI0038D03CB3